MWQIKSFSELSTQELFEIYRLRVATFVVAQKRIYQEVDDHDLAALHVFDQDKHVIAYARVFLDNDHITFGRIVTDSKHRGVGLGNQLMNHVLTTISENFPQLPIEIEAQVPVANFYKRFGFKTIGQPFIYNSTPHIKMTHEPLGQHYQKMIS
ncbi:GNAT family N-acetyltransferase [Secundilactobacillus folii]|uniref:GNAT family N-acetyltransferase n=1 Tax=Secundilactobacillus folii TaxID=2678357 RepID=A0A7X3C2D6_9LACO|nr:GNAT family N-acetyltransferase [Secundilactobacillus folii]MTV81451.1 GNAT family N-acetyltransferase [Secundilactobacillus folii]